jgi:hypothetical protein
MQGQYRPHPLPTSPRHPPVSISLPYWKRGMTTSEPRAGERVRVVRVDVDWSKARSVTFPNLKPSTTTISIRLPDTMLSELRRLANERDVPYQSLLKVYLAERIASERKSAGRQPAKSAAGR